MRGSKRSGIGKYEHHHQPLLPVERFLLRLLRHFGLSAAIIAVSLGMGMLGYRLFEGLAWVDALLNSAMLLGGMGPVHAVQTTGGKIFASFYALYSGLVFLVAAGILVAPVIHRLLHHFHLESEEDLIEESA